MTDQGSGEPVGTSPELSVALINWTADVPDDWSYLVDRARAAEEAGIDRVVVSDHVVFGEDLDAYGKPELGGMVGGRQPTGPDGCWLEPLTSLAVIAGATTRVRLGTSILLAALRRPAVLAKSLATLDVLSGGRVDLGVGVGWQREEYEAAGLDFGQRGRLLDHTLEVCTSLWQEQRVTYDSDELKFDGIHMMPKPVAAGRRADLGERDPQPGGHRAPRPLRCRVDPVGRRRRRPGHARSRRCVRASPPWAVIRPRSGSWAPSW